MESNKEESLRCIDIAIEKFNNGNYEGGFKFLNKSYSLYPNEKAKELEQFYKQKQQSNSDTGGSSTSNTPNSSTATPTPSTTPPVTSPPTYTVEQVAAIKKIKSSKSFYEILEVPKTATDVEIKKAYRKIALQLHPDKNHAPGAEDAFKMVTQAFSCLSDSKKRQNYDLHGAEDTVQNRSPFQRGGGFYYDEDISPEDVFENLFGFAFGGGGMNSGHVRRRGGAGAGGNGFQYYSTGFSPYGGGVRFQFPQQRRAGAGGAGVRQQEETSFSQLLLIFLPLLLIFFSMWSGGSSSSENETYISNLYRFDQDKANGYIQERSIHVDSYNINISYYVKDNFEKQLKYFRLSISAFEDHVMDKWLKDKRKYCTQKKSYEETLKRSKLNNERVAEIQNELKSKKYEYCDVLKTYFRL